MKKIIFTIVIILIVAAGVYLFTKPQTIIQELPQPITYTEHADVSVAQELGAFDYSQDDLEALAKECGREIDKEKIQQVISTYGSSNKIIYNFTYAKPSQAPKSYKLTILPNLMNFTDIEQVKEIFDVCSAGGDAYPTELNNEWLIFEGSCGTGFDDGSGLPNGCLKAKELINYQF